MNEQDRIGPESATTPLTREDLNDFARYPIRDVETIAKRLEDVAVRLRVVAERFRDEKTKPSTVLATIVAEYVQLTGNNGTYFYNLVSDVEQLRAHRAGGAK